MDGSTNYGYEQPPRPRISRMAWIGIGVGAVVLASSVIVVMRLRAPATLNTALVGASKQVATESDACATALNPDACRAAAIAKAALAFSTPETCRALTEVALDDCLWSVASKNSDSKVCEQMADVALAAQCADGIARDKAVAVKSESLCDAVKDAGRKSTCLQLISPTTSVNCAVRGETADTCAALIALEKAIASGDSAQCTKLVLQGACFDQIGSSQQQSSVIDTDGDGLTDSEEVDTYHSNPLKADTDGDSFSDGAEVKGGYNPNGPGKLVLTGV